ncbi:MAG TPA: type II toxin-antitoxin system prevent-host-death family antitoxin [Vicinamibacteria bacterium]|nr:type II toxin-antitoxin system prevent-host-death family antitoxin [Vicinamibacteria bacterium]
MPRAVSAVHAKEHFAEFLRKAEAGDTVVITRHGKPVAALVAAVSADEMERLAALGPAGGLASVAGGWRGSAELVRLLSRKRRVRSRRVARLED